MKTKIPFAGRCFWLGFAVLALSCWIACRLVQLHIINSDVLRSTVSEQLIEKEHIPAERGIIMDRNEEILTNNIQSTELIANRYHLREITAVVYGLAYNQVSNSDKWKKEKDPAKRRKMVARERSRLLELAQRELSKDERAQLRRQIKSNDANANRLAEFDPEKCEALFKAHDELVAEILYPFLQHIEIREKVVVEPEKTLTRKGKRITIPAKVEERIRYTTRQDIINLIAQPEVEASNKEAEARGEKKRGFRMNIPLARANTRHHCAE